MYWPIVILFFINTNLDPDPLDYFFKNSDQAIHRVSIEFFFNKK